MTLLLMAAGKGSRYGKLKQFDGLGPMEEFLMEFSIYDALQVGFDHIVVITQKSNVEFLRDHLISRLPENTKLDVLSQELTDLPTGLEVSAQREKPWGTAHAVWTARHVISEPFVVVNADDYYGKKAYAKAANFMDLEVNRDRFGLVAYTLRDTLSEFGSVSRGVCKQKGSNLLSVEERIKIEDQEGSITDTDSGIKFTGDELVSMNFWVCSPAIFDQIENDLRLFIEKGQNLEKGEVYLPFVIQEMLQKGNASVEVIPSESNWFGVTYANDKDIAVNELREMTDQGDYRSPLWETK
ncbi:MAG: nucleotidyltransferase family protein [Flavobacteriaceae bacterium]